MKRAVKRIIILVSFAAISLGAVSLNAHDVYHITGKVIKVSDTEISVQDQNHKIFRIGMAKFTMVWLNKTGVAGVQKRVLRGELEVGLTVSVNASGDGEEDLTAQHIIIVPPPKPTK